MASILLSATGGSRQFTERMPHLRSSTIGKVAVLLCCAAFSGCLTTNIVVTVRPDGSGSLEQTARLRPSAMAQFERLVSPDPTAAPSPPPAGFLRQPDDRSPALWGRGIRLRSSRSLNAPDLLGWSAIYDFVDVRALEVDLLPRIEGLDLFAAVGAAGKGVRTGLRTTLEPAADGLQRLTVHFPRFALDPSIEPPAAWASGSAAEMAALRNVMNGSRLTITFRTEAPLVSTNSPHREGDGVVLFDMDVEQALFSRQFGMLAATPATFDDLLWAIGDVPGVTLAPDHDVTLEFHDPDGDTSATLSSGRTPDSEVFLAAFSNANGKVTVGAPVNITNSRGGDGEPSFTPDGRELLFTSTRAAEAPDAGAGPQSGPPQADIYRYDITSGKTSRVTRTRESESSPMVMPGAAQISFIRSDADGTRRLWSIAPDGREPVLLLPDLSGVASYAWVDERVAAVVMARDGDRPASVRVVERPGSVTTVASGGIGRSILRMPSGALSFVQRDPAPDGSAPVVSIKQLMRPGARGPFSTPSLTRPVAQVADPVLAWLPDGTLLMPHDGTLYRWTPGERNWVAVADFGQLGLQRVTRIAVSPKGDRLAIAAQPR